MDAFGHSCRSVDSATATDITILILSWQRCNPYIWKSILFSIPVSPVGVWLGISWLHGIFCLKGGYDVESWYQRSCTMEPPHTAPPLHILHLLAIDYQQKRVPVPVWTLSRTFHSADNVQTRLLQCDCRRYTLRNDANPNKTGQVPPLHCYSHPNRRKDISKKVPIKRMVIFAHQFTAQGITNDLSIDASSCNTDTPFAKPPVH